MTEGRIAEAQNSPHAAQLRRGFPWLRFEPGLEQEFMEDYIQKYVPRNRPIYQWFDVFDLEEERI